MKDIIIILCSKTFVMMTYKLINLFYVISALCDIL